MSTYDFWKGKTITTQSAPDCLTESAQHEWKQTHAGAYATDRCAICGAERGSSPIGVTTYRTAARIRFDEARLAREEE